MSAETKRVVILCSVLAVAALVVVFDRLAGTGAEADDAASGRRAVYLAEASLAAQIEEVAASKDEWEASARSLRSSWAERRAKMIVAPSGEIAASRLRNMIEQVLLDEGLSMTTSETLATGGPNAGEPVAVVGLSVSFESSDAVPVYRVIDRIEHLPDATTRVEAVTLRGPGRLGGGGTLQVTLRLQAVALIERNGRG